ncbi:MAG: Ig-like domain-containing protein [Anaerolineales bacterium]
MNKRTIIWIFAISLVSLLLVVPVSAQQESPDLEIKLNRDFGYGGFGGEIQGTFSIRAEGPETLAEVSFYMDETLLGKDAESPFALQFNTDNYPPGQHKYHAVGVLDDGSEIRSNEITAKVLSEEDSMSRTLNIVGPILGIALIGILLGAVVPALMGKKGKPGKIGEYSMAGGTVCPRCSFPYSRHTFSPNMIFGKLERCPHCGKWSIRPRASQADLVAAEERLRASQEEQPEIEIDPQDSLRRALDDSRYDD